MFVLWLNRILPNLPVCPQGFWLPAVQENGGVRSYGASELRAEGAHRDIELVPVALGFYFTVWPKLWLLLNRVPYSS